MRVHRRVHRYVLLGSALLLLGCSRKPASHSVQHPRSVATSSTSPEAAGVCLVTLEGRIHGTVTQTGADTPPVYVTVIFSGGPTERQQVREGQYALPLLARRCADGVHWVSFGLSAPGASKGVLPTGPDVRDDLEVGEVPPSVPANLPDCLLVLGTLSGHILMHGTPAPDGTRVTSAGPPGTPSLDQLTVTRDGGRYSLPSLGLRCGSGPPQMLIASVSALGMTIPVSVQTMDAQQDIMVP